MGPSSAIDVCKVHVIFHFAAIKSIHLVFSVKDDPEPPNLFEAQKTLPKRDVDSNFLAMLVLEYYPEHLLYTGFATTRSHGQLSQVHNMYRTNTEVHYVFRAHNSIQHDFDSWVRELENSEAVNFFEPWYPKHKTDPFIQFGDYPEPENCPMV